MASTNYDTGMGIPAFLGLGISLVVVSAVFATLRLVANIQSKRLFVDDCVPFIAVVFITTYYGLAYEAVKALLNPQSSLLFELNLATAIDFMAGFAMWTSKVPIILLYVRLFGVKTWLRIASYTTIGAMAALFLSGMTVVGVTCTPHGNLSVNFLLKCTTISSKMGVFIGTTAVVADVIILLIPLPVIYQLRLPTHRKIGLFFVFLTGIFGIAASAVSLAYKWRSLKGTSANLTAAIFCTLLESCIAIIVGCVPATYSLWSNFVAKLSLYSKIKSAFSSVSVSRSEKHAKDSTPARGSHRANHGEVSPRVSSEYIVLGDANSTKAFVVAGRQS